MMADGHLNKCKDCARADTAKRHDEKSKDPAWLESEIERHRLKMQKARDEGRAKPITSTQRRTAARNYRKKFPQKYSAKIITGNAKRDGDLIRQPCEVCGNPKSEAHHEDYSRPLEVRWLCKKHHMDRHNQIRKEKRQLNLST